MRFAQIAKPGHDGQRDTRWTARGLIRLTTATEDHSSERLRVPAVAHVPPLPEQGQIVNVRGATWAVADVRAQGLPRSPADEAEAGLTHVVRLQSLDEDRLGQELAVVWELEVGQTVAPDQGLPETISPDGFDDPNTLAAFVDAVRWGAVTSADGNAFQAPFRSGANVEAYQLEPLRRALQSARTNLLLADDVGLARRSRPAWSCRNCCCAIAPGRSSSCARRACR